jgi:hypothetical protein
MLFSKEVRFRNEWRNHRKILQKYSGPAERISELVREANRSIGFTAGSRRVGLERLRFYLTMVT